MITILFFIISGVCAPWDDTYCGFDYNLMPLGDGRKRYYDGGYIITFNVWHRNFFEKDCWGLTTFQHEWLHVQIGYWHLAGWPVACMFRQGYSESHLQKDWLDWKN